MKKLTQRICLWLVLATLALGLTRPARADATLSYWTQFNGYATAFPYVLMYGQGKFRAAGYGSVFNTVDGQLWSGSITNDFYSAMVAGPTGPAALVAVGASSETFGGLITTSPDGVTWTNQLIDGYYNLNDVLWTGTQFITVGSTFNGPGIMTSSDGLAWVSRFTEANLSKSLVTLAANATMVVAAGSQGAIMTSPDGITWTARTSNTTNYLESLASSGNLFVVVGDGGLIKTSPDGVVWTTRDSGVTDDLLKVRWNGSQFLAVGGHTSFDDSGVSASTSVILTSADGIEWDKQSPGTTEVLLTAASNGTAWMVMGQNSTILTSPDGVAWTSHPFMPGTLHAVGKGTPAVTPHEVDGELVDTDDAFVAVGGRTEEGSGDPKFLIWTEDGGHFTTQDGPVNGTGYGVIWSGNQFVAVGQEAGTGAGLVLLSTNGTVWANYSASADEVLRSVAANAGGLLVAVGGNASGDIARIETSPDGMTWTAQDASAATSGLLGVTWSGNQFVAVGGNGTILTSFDGTVWTAQASGTTETLRSIGGNSSLFVTVGDGGTLLTSPDAITWTLQPTDSTADLQVAGWDGLHLLALGTGGTVLISTDGVAWTAEPSAPEEEDFQGQSGGNTSVIVTASSQIYFRYLYAVGPPVIYEQPISGTTVVGSYFSIAVRAYDDSFDDLSYQWYKNGKAIPGETESYFGVFGVKASDAGNYRVKVTGIGGSTMSKVAHVVVKTNKAPPRIVLQPIGRRALAGMTVNFSVRAVGPKPLFYQWYFNGYILSDGGKFHGTETSHLRVDKVTRRYSAIYQVMVSNLGGWVLSAQARLTVR